MAGSKPSQSIGFYHSLERGITGDLASGIGKSREREIAILCRAHEALVMKTKESPRGSDACAFATQAKEHALGRFNGGREHDWAMSNAILVTGDTMNDAAVEFPGRKRFPLCTLMVCFTAWLAITEVLVFDQVKFDARTQLLEQTARSLGGPQVVVPTERPPHLAGGATIQRL